MPATLCFTDSQGWRLYWRLWTTHILHRWHWWLPLCHTPNGVSSVYFSRWENTKIGWLALAVRFYFIWPTWATRLIRKIFWVRLGCYLPLYWWSLLLERWPWFVYEIAETSRNMCHRHSFFSKPFHHKAWACECFICILNFPYSS